MAIAAHTPGGYAGISQSVGQEFHEADRGKWGALTKSGKKKNPDTPKPRIFGQLNG
jgi:hypothetical protein